MSTDDLNNYQGDQPAGSPHLKTQISDDLVSATDQAKHDLDAIAQRAKDDAKNLSHQAGEEVGKATDKAKSFAADQKDLAAGQITGVAAAITKVADELEGTDQQTVARYARELASGLSSVGRTIKDRDVDDLMGLAQDFGRKEPVAFLGAAALAGFVASRFALASSHRRETKPSSGNAYQADGTTSATSSRSEADRSGGQ